MTTSWYDVLGVPTGAADDEVRTAWRSAIADLEPGDARFGRLNRAAEVLLDADLRARHDAELAPDPEEPDGVREPEPEEGADEPGLDPAARRRRLPARAGGAVGVAAAVALVVALVAGLTAYVLGDRAGEARAEALREARAAAEEAVVPVLSYDHRDLEAGQDAARAHLTSRYRDEYDDTFSLVAQNAPELEAVVRARLVDSAVVRAGEDRVQVLLFVDQETSNKETDEPLVYRNHVTASMQRLDGEWLVDDLRTQG